MTALAISKRPCGFSGRGASAGPGQGAMRRGSFDRVVKTPRNDLIVRERARASACRGWSHHRSARVAEATWLFGKRTHHTIMGVRSRG